jgi:ERCC4-related helicase
MAENSLTANQVVRHSEFGVGRVIADQGPTVVVRFETEIHECARGELSPLPSLNERFGDPGWDTPVEVVNHLQAEAIVSINDAWGVFGRSRIELLPHQLWVCREVLKEWPTRWLVADDVGLGKTIEAGILLTPLVASGRVNRLLVICPAHLVEQWQLRMRTMFDIRLAIYTSEADTPRTDFWHTHNHVIVSLHTLRADHKGRHDRLLESEPFDLVIVDESHHLNADENAGPTLAFQLVRKMEDHGLIQSMIFFTGTPHRGKTFGFLAQLQLIRPDLFDPRKPLADQVLSLRKAVIRNNKHNVTDLAGHRLFEEPIVTSETYSYTDSEQSFYDAITDFIVRGRAYAARLPTANQSAVSLVLIAMQKLASSSVAAIRRAIAGRLERIERGRTRLEEQLVQLTRLDNASDAAEEDMRSAIEEEIAALQSDVRLMEDEEPWLRNLLGMADAVTKETKIETILDLIDRQFPERSILFFTEYKATQSLLMSALIGRYGDGCVTFINGDGKAAGVVMADGSVDSVTVPRLQAADAFNMGKVRFLVSTEAAGEGIDLQESCHTLIHVDLPWNPMRLHQRVGRLDRYGQKRRVEVVSVRNPSTVESRIMAKLEEKLERITAAFTFVMDSPEDLKQLVLGVASPATFRDLYADSVQVSDASLSAWFDTQTSTLGGKDVVEVVQALVGDVRKFDFKAVSDRLPQVDLPDLESFLEIALSLNGRKLSSDVEGLSFLTPTAWRTIPAIRGRYQGLTLKRDSPLAKDGKALLGIGHRAIDLGLAQARDRHAAVASLPSGILEDSLFVFRLIDRVTDGPTRRPVVVGVVLRGSDGSEVLSDWQILRALNALPWRRDAMQLTPSPPDHGKSVADAASHAEAVVVEEIGRLVPEFRVPDCELLGVLWALPSDSE